MHSDLKPSNILVNRNCDLKVCLYSPLQPLAAPCVRSVTPPCTCNLKVCDFGLSRACAGPISKLKEENSQTDDNPLPGLLKRLPWRATARRLSLQRGWRWVRAAPGSEGAWALRRAMGLLRCCGAAVLRCRVTCRASPSPTGL